MIGVSVSVKLASDDVRIAISQCIESHRPIIQGTPRWNMPDYVHHLLLLLGFLELAFNPLEHLARICGISQQEPILVVLSLCVH